MELFVRFDRNGKIISVAKVQRMHESLTHPFASLDEGEDVLKLQPTEANGARRARDRGSIFGGRAESETSEVEAALALQRGTEGWRTFRGFLALRIHWGNYWGCRRTATGGPARGCRME